MNLQTLITVLSLIGLTTAANGESKPVENNRIVRVGNFSLSDQDRTEIRAALQSMIQRDMAMQLTAVLEKKGFPKEEIEGILKSREFMQLAQRVSHHVRVTAALDRYIDRLSNPKWIENDERDREGKRALAQEAALRAYLLSRQLNADDTAKRGEKGTLWSQLWTKAKSAIFD